VTLFVQNGRNFCKKKHDHDFCGYGGNCLSLAPQSKARCEKSHLLPEPTTVGKKPVPPSFQRTPSATSRPQHSTSDRPTTARPQHSTSARSATARPQHDTSARKGSVDVLARKSPVDLLARGHEILPRNIGLEDGNSVSNVKWSSVDVSNQKRWVYLLAQYQMRRLSDAEWEDLMIIAKHFGVRVKYIRHPF
jgi:hypothetical protein